MRQTYYRAAALGILGAAIVLGGCKLKSNSMPAMDGPSTFGLNLTITASPDQLVADGHSSATVQVTLRDSASKPVVGMDVGLQITDSGGRPAGIGNLSALVARTGADGTARVVYTAPYRTDSTADQEVHVNGKVVSSDAGGYATKFVRIKILSAIDRLFPPIPGNGPPSCGFVMEPNVGPYYVWTPIPMQSTSSDSDGFIVRYEWDFGNGDTDDKPDIVQTYPDAGSFTITHTVVDNGGASSFCTRKITVLNR